MGLGFGKHAKGERAAAAVEPAADTSDRDTDTDADSGTSGAPDAVGAFSTAWSTALGGQGTAVAAPDAPGASGTASDPDASGDTGDTNAPSAKVVPGTVLDGPSNVPDETDTPIASGPSGSSAADVSDAVEAPGAKGVSGTVLDDQDASDAASAPSAFSTSGNGSAPGAPDDAMGAPFAQGPTFTPSPAADQEAPEVPAQRVPGVPVIPGVPGGRPAASTLPDAPAAGLDGPLLADIASLRASWQRIQGAFVDDPGEAVADAANLVEHSVQALVGALRQRQRLLRAAWDRGGSPDGSGSATTGAPAAAEPAAAAGLAPDDMPDTEQLRLLIQQYRTLFNEICRP